jgi:hypothetical protein
MVLQCTRLQKLDLNERRKVLEESGLCMYCLSHAAELECYGPGGTSNPRFQRPGCGGEHSTGAHALLGEVDASVNLVAGEDSDPEDDEEWWVNTVRVEREEEDPAELESLESEDHGEEADRYCISACMRKDDFGLEDKLEYFWDAPIPSDSDEQEEDRWWSPGPREPSPEEDEEEVHYFVNLLGGGPKEGEEKEEEALPRLGTEMSHSGKGCWVAMREPEGGEGASPRPLREDEPPPPQRSPRGGNSGGKGP